jgi:hypothetical protein
MSCNHCAAASAKYAARTGTPDIEAAWADNRNFIGICPVCRNCFLRRDGGCTKCENGLVAMAQKNPARFVPGYRARDYSARVLGELAPVMAGVEDDSARAVAAEYLTDPVTLGNLSNDEVVEVQAAVAGNTHTPAPALHRLLTSTERAVYRPAANNPALPVSAVAQAAKEVNEKWLNLVRVAMQPLIMARAFSGGKGSWLVTSMVVGMYGQDAYRYWRRKRDLELAIRNRPEPEETVKDTPPAMQWPQPPRLLSRPGAADARLNEAERLALHEELKITEAGLAMAEDYYDGQITMADVARIETEGAVTDREAEISGYILEKARETALNFPGWHDGLTEPDFARMQDKLRCQKCGLYAGSRSHQCGYTPRLTLAEPPTETEPAGVNPVDIYQTN